MAYGRRYRSWASAAQVLLTAVIVTGQAVEVARAQLGGAAIAALQQRADVEGWTFQVGENAATGRGLDELCGLVVPDEWWLDGPPNPPAPPPLRDEPLPSAFDWRDVGGCPAVRDQQSCGSCWAFATVGVLECNVLIKDGQSADLSEQWLVSCNTSGYGCDGGWFAHQYHLATGDACGDSGAVLEAEFPYVAADAPCNCPYPHEYEIEAWGYVGSGGAVPAVEALKQAIVDHGPVAVAVYVDGAFQAYNGDVFNADGAGAVNHGVVLVGWDDNAGNGCWILRNSWGPGWGEGGYMRIEYGCSSVGYGACYIEYVGVNAAQIEVTPATLDFGVLDAGQSAELSLTVKNVGIDPLVGAAGGLSAPFSIVGSAEYNLDGGLSQDITVRFEPTLLGAFSGLLTFTGGGGTSATLTGTGGGSGVAADQCDFAPAVGDGSYSVSNTTAATTRAGSCGGGGTRDVWWCFTPALSGLATIDTHGSDFDTVLSVYDECGGSELACNDDADGHATSSVSIGVLESTEYWVRVAGCAGQSGNVELNIVTAAADLTFTGRVTDAYSRGVDGVTLVGLPSDPITDDGGYYEATVAYGFDGVVIPQKSGWEFEPAERVLEGLTAAPTDAWFVGRPTSLTINGTVQGEDGRGLAGVVLQGLPGNVRTGADGTYSATVDYGFSAIVLPRLSGYSFDPAMRVYDALAAQRDEQDYVATLLMGALTVTLEPEDARAAGALWRVDGGPWRGSDEVVGTLLVGVHVVEFAPLAGWTAPARELLSINADQTAERLVWYTPETPVEVDEADPSAPAEESLGDAGAGGDESPLPPTVAPLACGGGSVGLLPLTLLGLGVMRARGPVRRSRD